jgi:hypothetical protein
MNHVAVVKCYGKGTEAKPTCLIPDRDNKHTKKLHELLMKGPTSVNMLECEEDEDEKGCVNMVGGEDVAPKDEGWRTLNNSGWTWKRKMMTDSSMSM